ncbi:actin filament-coating protein tropomyosin [Gymnopus androsaceus JB14]|uniref:Actin filament-coating protein tropomyosin n=1 Tax=Gymnopus androsaceus JB14 TaxID=1447944 RepID=A0A6A4HT69_9AGAR|nr:actin filament-coating protein tropomyosin [Gymnopus androsaceus JB14]
MTEKIKEKLNNLRLEADAAIERAEASEAKNKKLEQALLEKEQEITSLTHRLAVADEQLEKNVDNVGSKTTSEGLQRKIQLLEEELDAAEKNAKDTVEKLRQVDVKAEHFERQVQRMEQERDAWEKKYEESEAKYQASKKELDELVLQMEGL